MIPERFESPIAFFSGFGSSTTAVMFLLDGSIVVDLAGLFAKVATAFIIGIAGGFGGLLVKDIYNFFKTKWRK